MIDATEIGEQCLPPPVCHEQKTIERNEHIMRAWLFCRVANGWDADARDHLALQKAELERFCKEHDLTVAGATMVTGNGRDELKKIVSTGIEQDSYDVLAAVSASRLGRDILGLLQIGEILTQHGKGLCLVKDGLSTHPNLILESTTEPEDSPEMGGQAL